MKSHSKSICAQYPIQSNQKNWNEVVEYILFALVLCGFKVVVHKIVWNVENCAINELLSNVDHFFVSKLMVFAVEYPHMFRLLVVSTNEKKPPNYDIWFWSAVEDWKYACFGKPSNSWNDVQPLIPFDLNRFGFSVMFTQRILCSFRRVSKSKSNGLSKLDTWNL